MKTKKMECSICGYVYDPSEGDAPDGIAPGVQFQDLPVDWVCPICDGEKEVFVSADSDDAVDFDMVKAGVFEKASGRAEHTTDQTTDQTTVETEPSIDLSDPMIDSSCSKTDADDTDFEAPEPPEWLTQTDGNQEPSDLPDPADIDFSETDEDFDSPDGDSSSDGLPDFQTI